MWQEAELRCQRETPCAVAQLDAISNMQGWPLPTLNTDLWQVYLCNPLLPLLTTLFAVLGGQCGWRRRAHRALPGQPQGLEPHCQCAALLAQW